MCLQAWSISPIETKLTKSKVMFIPEKIDHCVSSDFRESLIVGSNQWRGRLCGWINVGKVWRHTIGFPELRQRAKADFWICARWRAFTKDVTWLPWFHRFL
jgi:hypothetical protein